ncbi:transmembrane sensor [Chitinophaga sp. W3I9]|uniref:FecR family protein n=1 Tax=Chitinophaga sp. W3I9 TaxID=3373924 RepID=UPI003D1B43FC
MDHTAEEIKSLMIDKLDNHIDPEDELLLQRLISEQEDVQVMWEEMQQLFSVGKGKVMMEKLDTREEWANLHNELKKARRKKITRYIGMAAGIAAAATAVLLYLKLPGATHQKSIAATAPAKAILLKIDDGKEIDLTGSGSQAIVAGDARFHNNGKVLTLQGGASNQWSTISVPTGMDYQVKLSDSSILWLNAATTAHFPVNFTGNTREIEIRGEAYLQVAKDASRPFIVHLPGGAAIEVLGTAFNINSYDPAAVKVALVEGSVNMRTSTQTVGLKPGYQARVTAGAPVQVAAFDERQVLSWMKGQYIFYNTPVQEIALTLQRWYDVQVVIDNPAVGKKCFTGVINKQKKLQDFLDNLISTAEVSYYFQEGVLHFK